jgi:hypothetical protein
LFVIQMAVSLKNREPALAQVFVPSNENYNWSLLSFNQNYM